MRRKKNIMPILVSLAMVLFFGWNLVKEKVPLSLPISIPVPSQTPTDIPTPTIVFNNKTYAYAYFEVSNPGKIFLLPNFLEKLTSQEIADKYGCIEGINGGFYTTDRMPLGGFFAGMETGLVTKNPVQNRLIDGFVWSNGKTFFITATHPTSDAFFFLQTGPLFRLNGQVTRISIANDEERRRSGVGITKENTLVFFTVYNPESVYEGPLLSDMPALVQAMEQKTGFTFTNAVNLDGGSASAFISKKKTLQEFSPVGSFFCVQ